MKRRHPAGFTLLEILLVLVLLAITAVVVVPTLPEKRNDQVKEEAQKFYQLIQLWNEQSLLSGQTLGLRVEKNKYSLLRLTAKDWESMTIGRIKTQASMPEGIELQLEVTGFQEEEDRLFEKTSLFDDEMFAEEEQKQEPPQVVLMGNGELLPFTLSFVVDGNELWKVVGNDIGTFEIESLSKGG